MKAFSMAVAAVCVAGCFSAPSQPTPVSKVIGSAGGSVVSSDGLLTVTVPAGALASTQTITVSSPSSGPVPTSATAVGEAYEIGPSTLTLASALQVTLAAPSGTSSSDLAIYAAAEDQTASTPLESTLDSSGAVVAQLPNPMVVQLGHFLVVSGPTTGGTGTTTGDSTTGGGTTTATTGTPCGGNLGTTGAPGMPAQCQQVVQDCSSNPLYAVNCVQGNCQCITGTSQTGVVQTGAVNSCEAAWTACGFPQSIGGGTGANTTTGGGTGGTTTATTGGSSGGGTAEVSGLVSMSGAASTYKLSSDPSDPNNVLTIALAQNGLCGGFDATGPSVILAIQSGTGISPGDYSLTGIFGGDPGAAISVLDWDPDAGSYGVLANTGDGGLTISSLDGGLVSGSFSANVIRTDGSVATVSGSFTDVPVCGN